MKIEKYKKNKDTYRIFLSTGEIVDVYDEVIIRYNLIYKKEITDELLDEIKNYNDYIMAYNMCLKFLGTRLRAKSEFELYLKKKKFPDSIISYAVNRLQNNGLINDAFFTKAFIHDKLSFTSYGKYRIKEELNGLKIDSEIINLSLEEIDDEVWSERIDNLIQKYLAKKSKYSGDMLKNKTYMYLVNLGYDKNLIINILNDYFI